MGDNLNFINRWIGKSIVVYAYDGMLLGNEKNWTINISYRMNESQNNKLNEGSQASLTNKYILYGSIYKPRKYKLIYSDKVYQ